MNHQATLLLTTLLSVMATAMAAMAWRRSRASELSAAGIEDPRLWSVWRAMVRPIAPALAPRGNDAAAVLARLQHAGRSGKDELARFLEEKLFGYVLGPTVGAALLFTVGGKFGFFAFLVCATIGIVYPSMRLDSIAESRRAAIGSALPSAIDLLMTCIDAGLSIEQAIARVAKEFARSSPILAEEFGITAGEAEAGVGLTESLRRLARRVELDDLSGLCSVISQAHELGAPIVATLADYADSARKLRTAKLEEWAGKLAMQLLFPGVLFLLAALTVMAGPALVSAMSNIKGF